MDNWDEYLRSIQSGTSAPVTQPAQSGGFLSQLLGNLLNRGQSNSQNGAPVGGVPKPNGQGMYTPGMMMASAGPSTPINYSAIKSLLNSGVLKPGGQQPQAPEAPSEPATPEPAAAPKQNPLDMLFSSIFGGLFK